MAARDVRRTVLDVAFFVGSQVALWYALNYYLRPDGQSSSVDSKKVSSTLERLGKKGLKLTEHEKIIAAEIIHPDDISVRFSDIGGLETIVASLRESVVYPLVYPTLFSADEKSRKAAALYAAPKGVLLHGPPGCGKTLLAKALAKESNATFINVPFSVLTNKWYGESNKLVHALFDLAEKLAPAIIFLDEIDMFLRERAGGDHEVTGMMKAEFMTLWDGLLSGSHQILVLGATNRPLDIDSAILRRLPKRFAVGLPDEEQRKRILTLMLPDDLSSSDIAKLAQATGGFSGSDLKEMCRDASMMPVREFMRENGGDHENMVKGLKEGSGIRPLKLEDFFSAENTHSPITLRPHTRGRGDGTVDLD
ncbi:AAA-domain-containing protein [Clavulina sp. PMI_390]|nr:AAA-domain-containing protein [Clavulina sp. PMI_390]